MRLTKRGRGTIGEHRGWLSLAPVRAVRTRRVRQSALAALLGLVILANAVPNGQTANPTPTASPRASAAMASPSPTVGASPSVGPGGTPATIQTADAEIGQIVWAASLVSETNAPRQRITTFSATAPVIYAVLPVAWVKTGTKIQATWSFDGTPLPAFTTMATIPAEERELWLEFHLDRGKLAAWPSGTYEISIAINGQPATSAKVVVGTPQHS